MTTPPDAQPYDRAQIGSVVHRFGPVADGGNAGCTAPPHAAAGAAPPADARLGAALVPELALTQFAPKHAQVHRGALDAAARVLTVAHRTGRAKPTAATSAAINSLRQQARLTSGLIGTVYRFSGAEVRLHHRALPSRWVPGHSSEHTRTVKGTDSRPQGRMYPRAHSRSGCRPAPG